MTGSSHSRRSFLQRAGAAAGIAGAGLARPALAQTNLRNVTMTLDWVIQGPNGGFMVAQAKGFYREVGLNVEIGPGKGSGTTAQLVASKATQFGFADGYVVALGNSKGMNLRTVAAIYRKNPIAAIVLEDSAIKSPKDLEGKTIGIPAGGAQFQQWPAFVQGCKLDGSKIRVANVDPTGSPVALATGKFDAVAGYVNGHVPSIEIRGRKKARLFWYADCGVTAVSNGIIVHNDLIKEDPELVRKFVAASLKGFLYGRTHLDEMIEIVRKLSPTIDPAIAKRETELTWDLWQTPNTAGKPLGWNSEKDWEDTVAVLKQFGGVTVPIEAKQNYTNEFVPMGAEFVPPPLAGKS
jgi:NitT/TauT family transport system substrate-binding protein